MNATRKNESPVRRRMPLWAKAILWFVASLVAGVAAGQGGVVWAEAPFYFGFFVGFVLVGLSGLFALAADVAGPPG